MCLVHKPQVFERVRKGDENLQAVAQGSLCVFRELILRSMATGSGGSGGNIGGSRATVGAAAAAGGGEEEANLETSARRVLLSGLRGALPLLLETDSHALVQVMHVA